MRVYALIFSALFCFGAAAETPTRTEPRIVSTSLCGDTYVLDMVPAKHIAALSWQADDPLSLAPDHLRNKPKAWDDLERLLALEPTHIVFGPGEGMTNRAMLNNRGIKTINIDWVDSINLIHRNREKLATGLGQIASLNGSNDEMPGIFVNSPDVLYLSRAGGTAGPDTYVDDAITAAGGINMIKTKGWHTPDPELLVSLNPDLIVTSFFEQGYESINANGLRHSLLQSKLANTPHVNVPGALWPCAGPGMKQATQIIAKAIEGLDP